MSQHLDSLVCNVTVLILLHLLLLPLCRHPLRHEENIFPFQDMAAVVVVTGRLEEMVNLINYSWNLNMRVHILHTHTSW